MKCQVAEIQWGGGVVAEIFCDLRKPSRFSGGGGVVAENFGRLRKPSRFSGGGGGSSRIFALLPPKAGTISVGEG